MEVDRIICGNCLEVLRQFPDNSIDAVVTDPPYGLNEIKDLPGLLRAWMDGEDGSEWQTKGFMGKGWDKVPPPSVWREVLRVMKPGAYILCFAGCRTVDLMGISLRLAGFEDNNLLAWLQGQGFPKATDVGKMIDRAAGAEREVILPGAGHEASPDGAAYGHGLNAGFKLCQLTALATPEAKKWGGWKYGKQALKPAMEPILLMQKPFEKGLAGYQNVLKWGTGALNVEGCRIPTQPRPTGTKNPHAPSGVNAVYGYDGRTDRQMRYDADLPPGRFPANVLLDEEAARMLDEQSGDRSSTRANGNPREPRRGGNSTPLWGMSDGRETHDFRDLGGASRFYYVAKASTRERNAGLDERNLHPTVKPIELMRYLVRLITPPGGIVLDPFCGTGTTCIAAMLEGFHYIGIDFEPKYCEWAEKRIAWHRVHPPKSKKKKPARERVEAVPLL